MGRYGLAFLLAFTLLLLSCAPTDTVERKPMQDKILFISDRDGNAEIYVMDADGSNLNKLTDVRLLWFPMQAWSPDGSKVVFAGGDPPNFDI